VGLLYFSPSPPDVSKRLKSKLVMLLKAATHAFVYGK
jgi:hypothetical protein